jgi:hypothetical protein
MPEAAVEHASRSPPPPWYTLMRDITGVVPSGNSRGTSACGFMQHDAYGGGMGKKRSRPG